MRHFKKAISKSELLLEVCTVDGLQITLDREGCCFQISAEAFQTALDDLNISDHEERKPIDSNHLQVSD